MKHKILFLFIVLPFISFADIVGVSNSNDSGNGSFRNAVAVANTGDTISFLCGLDPIILTSGQITITKELFIYGCSTYLTISKNSDFRIMEIAGTSIFNVKFIDFNFYGGKTDLNGAGLYVSNPEAKLFFDGCNIYDNITTGSGNGTGIYFAGSTLEFMNCNIYNNTFETSKDDLNYFGSGLFVTGASVNIENCAFYNNTQSEGGSAIFSVDSDIEIVNTTFHGNNTRNGNNTSAGSGGAIYVSGISNINLLNCTITKNATGNSENSTSSQGGGIYIENTATVNIENTIISGNILGTSATYEGFDVYGHITSFSHNIIGKVEGCTGIVNGTNSDIAGTNNNPVDAGLQPLSSSGGKSKVCSLSPSSIAIDAAHTNYNALKDQRNYDRDSNPDIGAFEFGLSPIITSIKASSPDGIYYFRDEIIIDVVFDRPVSVIGDFFLKLETGNEDHEATYIASPQNDTIQFKYIVQNEDFTNDLDVLASTSLYGGHNCVIHSTDYHQAVLIMPQPGEVNSLSYNSDIEINATSTIKDINKKCNIFPNPATNYIYINNNIKNTNIDIINIEGQTVMQITSSKNKVDISSLPKGVYFVKIEKETFKFVKK